MALFSTLRNLLGLPVLQERGVCMIVSEQEGAEIWIDGRKSPFVTPQMIPVPQHREVHIEVRLIGHEPHHVTLRSPHKLSYYYCNLQRIPLKLIRNEVQSSVSL